MDGFSTTKNNILDTDAIDMEYFDRGNHRINVALPGPTKSTSTAIAHVSQQVWW